MKWSTIVTAFLLSGCIATSNTETSSTSSPNISPNTQPEMESVEKAVKDKLPDFVPTRFICEDKEDIIKFVNVDMFKENRTAAEQSAELRGLGSEVFSCNILRVVLYLVPFERVLRYKDQDGFSSVVYQVYTGNNKTGYVVAIDPEVPKQDIGISA
jgi:hypothetical protein